MMANDSEGGRSGPGLFTSLGGHYGPGAGANLGQLSPYLSVDPSYLQQVGGGAGGVTGNNSDVAAPIQN